MNLHACDASAKQFLWAQCLAKHMLTLTGVKVYVCDVYGKRLRLARHLKGHMLIYTVE